ncbi:MAG: hypothetical protein LRY38_06300 [Aeromonadaceae bacterium]|nr:hypothetical protein [Aeromonadaceae bacterium]
MVPLGHYLDDTGHSVFRVFAPDVAQLDLLLEGHDLPLPMEQHANGYWTLRRPPLAEGHRYRYRVNGTAYPDPASRAQPDGVHGPSAVAYPPQRGSLRLGRHRHRRRHPLRAAPGHLHPRAAWRPPPTSCRTSKTWASPSSS